MKLPDLTRRLPLGYPAVGECTFCLTGLAVSALWSMIFFVRYFGYRGNLYGEGSGGRVLLAGAMMPDFVELLDHVFLGFLLLAAAMLGFIAAHYAYHWQGSRSIYLMRRLPDRFELHRRCLTVPFCMMLVCAGCAFVLLLLYFAVYMVFTPSECVRPDQWYRIWRFM